MFDFSLNNIDKASINGQDDKGGSSSAEKRCLQELEGRGCKGGSGRTWRAGMAWKKLKGLERLERHDGSA